MSNNGRQPRHVSVPLSEMDAFRLQQVADEWSFDPESRRERAELSLARLLASVSYPVTEVVMNGLNASEVDMKETQVSISLCKCKTPRCLRATRACRLLRFMSNGLMTLQF